MSYQVLNGDALTMLKALPSESVNCIVTSPPYYGLRDYGHDGQIGLEQTPQEFIGKLVDVFRECRRVLTKDGTCWVNMGDSYCNSNGFARASADYQREGRNDAPANDRDLRRLHDVGFKTKDLMGIPWRLAFALHDDGWYLRQDIIWAKPNPMPESVRDRCTKAHEYIFMLTKSAKYWYDAAAIKEPAVTDIGDSEIRYGGAKYGDSNDPMHATKSGNVYVPSGTRNRRSVWSVATKPFAGAHFAVMPGDLVEPCILAGCPENGVVLDPFAGSGTTLAVAVSLGRRAIGIELNPEYVSLIEGRMSGVTPSLFAGASK